MEHPSSRLNKGDDNLALLAKAWAIELPCLIVGEKEWVLRELAVDNVSFTIWPIIEREELPTIRALQTTTYESPSTIEC